MRLGGVCGNVFGVCDLPQSRTAGGRSRSKYFRMNSQFSSYLLVSFRGLCLSPLFPNSFLSPPLPHSRRRLFLAVQYFRGLFLARTYQFAHTRTQTTQAPFEMGEKLRVNIESCRGSYCKYAISLPTRTIKNPRHEAERMESDTASERLAVMFLSAVMACYFPLHEAQKPPRTKQ